MVHMDGALGILIALGGIAIICFPFYLLLEQTPKDNKNGKKRKS